ncbi:MAG: acyltransferase [Coriobacteriia bacterium]|nr:acyltransferase [Coriobacteriia bacterium]
MTDRAAPTATTVARPRQRVAIFDALRVLGVALVVGVHLLQRAGSPLGNAFGIPGFYEVTLGGVGVTILLVLSGAVTHLTYSQRDFTWLSFMRRRLAHIYPTYWLAIGATVLLAGSPVLADRVPLKLALDLSGMWVFTGRSLSGYILSTGWFIGLIVVLYAAYPLLARCMRRRPLVTLLVVLALSVASRLLVGATWPAERYNDWVPFGRLFEFTFGMWLVASPRRAAMVSGWLTPTPALGRALEWAAAVSFPLFLVHRAVLDYWMLPVFHPAVYVALFAAASVALSEVIRRVAAPVERYVRG